MRIQSHREETDETQGVAHLEKVLVGLPAKSVLHGEGGLGRLFPLQEPVDQGGLTHTLATCITLCKHLGMRVSVGGSDSQELVDQGGLTHTLATCIVHMCSVPISLIFYRERAS